jgi:hypothetical protein
LAREAGTSGRLGELQFAEVGPSHEPPGFLTFAAVRPTPERPSYGAVSGTTIRTVRVSAVWGSTLQ